jgi:transposase
VTIYDMTIGFGATRFSVMPAIKYKVNLTGEEKCQLEDLVHKGQSAARSQTRARILLKAAAGVQDKDIIEALDVSPSMVAKTRQRCVEEGPEAALKERPRPGQAPKLTDQQAAHLIAIACSDAPEGHGHWTLRLLADKVVELDYAGSCSYELIRRLLKKTR